MKFAILDWNQGLISCMLALSPTPYLPCVNCVGICLPHRITNSFEARKHTLGMFIFPTVHATSQARIIEEL